MLASGQTVSVPAIRSRDRPGRHGWPRCVPSSPISAQKIAYLVAAIEDEGDAKLLERWVPGRPSYRQRLTTIARIHATAADLSL